MTTPPTPADDSFAGLVLAGGDSTRYGERNKLLEPVHGRPLVARVVDTLWSLTGAPPTVVTRTPGQREAVRAALPEAAVRFAADDPAYDGPLGGLAGALPGITATWVVVCAGDLPFLSRRALATLLERRDETTDAVVPVRDSVREPLHAVYRRSAVVEALERVPRDAGPRALCRLVACTDVPLSEGPSPLERSVLDLNTTEEFERLLSTGERDGRPLDQP